MMNEMDDTPHHIYKAVRIYGEDVMRTGALTCDSVLWMALNTIVEMRKSRVMWTST